VSEFPFLLISTSSANTLQVKLKCQIIIVSTLTDSLEVRFRTLPLRLRSSILFAVADFASACNYLCL